MQDEKYIENLLHLESYGESCCKAVYYLIDKINLNKKEADIIDYIDEHGHTQYFLIINEPKSMLSIVCSCTDYNQKTHRAYLIQNSEPSFILKS